MLLAFPFCFLSSAKEKKAAFTSKPVADLLGQRKKKEGAEKGKQPEQGREALFEKQKEKKKQAGKEAVIRGEQKIENKMERPKVRYLYREPYRWIR